MKFSSEINGGHFRRGRLSPAVLLLLLANVGGAASASLERKRLTVNTDSHGASDPLGLANPFGVERNLEVWSVQNPMCMSMSMPMCMSMSMSMSLPMFGITFPIGIIDAAGLTKNGANTLVSPGDNDITVETDETNTASEPNAAPNTPEIVGNILDSVPETNQNDSVGTSNNTPDTTTEPQNSPAQSQPTQDNPQTTTTETTTTETTTEINDEITPSVSNESPTQVDAVVKSNDSLSCPSFENENMNQFTVNFAFEVTGANNVDDVISAADAAVLNGLSDLVSCDAASRQLADIISKKRSLRSEERQLNDFVLREINIDSRVSDEYTCTSQDEACTVVMNTLTLKTDDGSVSGDDVKSKTLSTVQESLSSMQMLSYTSMENLSTPQAGQTVNSSEEAEGESDERPNISVSAQNTDTAPGDDNNTTSSEAGLNGATTGALVAGAFAAVLGAVFVFRKRRASSSEVEYVGEDVSEEADMEREVGAII